MQLPKSIRTCCRPRQRHLHHHHIGGTLLLHLLPCLVVMQLLLLSCAPVALACPTDAACTCKWKGGKQTVECAANQLSTLPDGMDAGTQVLNFSGNALQVLRSERFFKMDLINLQKIYLCRNQITRIYEKAFRGLSNLVELDLADNLLTTVPSDTFGDYAALMRLTLSGNPIRELRTNAFRQLTYLTTLELSNCQIERVEDGAFEALENLEWLRLDGNRIATIRGQHVLPKSLHGIDLHGNRWNCDCFMGDLHAWLVNYNVPQQTADAPKCVYPARLKGETIRYLKSEELACMPDISPKTLFLELLEGRNVSLHCDVVAVPEAQVSWWFQGQILQNDSLYDANLQMFYYVEDSVAAVSGSGTNGLGAVAGATKKHSELFLYNTRLEHNGTFQCVAENLAGRMLTNYTIRVLPVVPVVPVEVPVLPVEYMLVAMVAAAVSGAVFVLLCCCLLVRCVRSSRGRRRHPDATKDSTVQLQNSKCSSIISDGTTATTHQAPMSILKHSNGSGMQSGGVSSGAGIMLGTQQEMLFLNASNAMAAGNVHQQQHQQHQQQQLMQQQQHLSMQHQLQQQQQQLHHPLQQQSAALQYCSPPASTRSYQLEPQNPDLINDAAEANKCRQQQQQQHDDDTASEHNGSIQGSHMSCENGYHPVLVTTGTAATATTTLSISGPSAAGNAATGNNGAMMKPVSAVPRFNPLATLPRGLIKDMYQHQVDVHLNPGYFLGSPDAAGYPVEYRMHQQMMQQQQQQQQQHMHQQQQIPMMMMPAGNQVNYYRTLPHKPKHQQQQLHAANSAAGGGMPRYSMDAEFATGRPPFDAYTLRDMRYTAHGYPMQHMQHQQQQQQQHQQQQQQHQQQHHHPKQVAFLDEQYPSPPDGYKTCDVIAQQPLHISTSTSQNTAAPGASAASAMHHQWPPCLPGYHQQQQQQQQQQLPAASATLGGAAAASHIVPIQTQPAQKPQLHHQASTSLISPTSSTASSTTTQTSQTSSSQASQTGGGPSAAPGTSSLASGGAVTKRCVAAQTLDPKDTIHEVANENDVDDEDEDDDGEEVEEEEADDDDDDDVANDDTRKKATAVHQGLGAAVSVKLKHLNGPLADSPDEGYVGDSQDGSDM